MLDDKEPIDIIYLDFKKAFDSVPHERLMLKLSSYGIQGNVQLWIRNFLADRTQRVRVGKDRSRETRVLSGIPQGSILGPILFTVFINDLSDCVEGTCKIFADDTKLYGKATEGESLQKDLNALHEWSHQWKLYFNITKCKVMHIGNNNPGHIYFMTQDDKDIAMADCQEEKDFGSFV